MIPTSLPTNLNTVTAHLTARIGAETHLLPEYALLLLTKVLDLQTTQDYLFDHAIDLFCNLTPTHKDNPQP